MLMDKPGLKESVGSAMNASNLASDARKETAVDRVAALSRADELGSALWRLKAGGDLSVIARASTLLALRVRQSDAPGLGEWTRLPSGYGLVLRICQRIVNEWLQDRCPKCKGRGRTGMGKGSVKRELVDCATCSGSGQIAHVGTVSKSILETGTYTFNRHYRFKGQTRTKPKTIAVDPAAVTPQSRPCQACRGVGKIAREAEVKGASLGKICTPCQGSGKNRINGAARAEIVGVSRVAYWKTWDARFLAIRRILGEADGETVEEVRTALRGPRE